jgi:hypothetical protein
MLSRFLSAGLPNPEAAPAKFEATKSVYFFGNALSLPYGAHRRFMRGDSQ